MTPPGWTATFVSVRSLRTHRSRAVAALCAGALTISACGGTDDDSSSNPSPDPASAATTVATEPPTETPAPDSGAPVTDTPTTDAPVGDAPATSSPASTDPDPAAAGIALDVPEILQVSAPLVGGGGIDLADYADRPLLLWFWAPF